MNNGTLVLIDNLYEQYHLEDYQGDGVRFEHMLKSEQIPYFLRAVRKFHLSSALPLKEIWFAVWEEIIKEYSTIILGDAGNTFNVVRYIKKKYPDKRVVVWYRNSVSATVNPNKIDRSLCELWSFDSSDCEKYGMNYNPQFYMKNVNYRHREIEYDAFFIGKDKGRLNDLLNLENELNNRGLITKFCIIGYNSDYISYDKVLDYISKSRIVVDMQAEWQEGITLRPLEALFYEKKLITNNNNISSYDYYRKNNIFVLGRDPIDSVVEFIDTPYEKVEDRVVNQYNEIGWIDRFNKGVDK